MRYCRGDRGHAGIGEIAGSVDAGHTGFAALVDPDDHAERRVEGLLNVPDPHQSARLFGALFKGSDLLIIARFDEAKAEDDYEIDAYCRAAVDMFIAAHGGNVRSRG